MIETPSPPAANVFVPSSPRERVGWLRERWAESPGWVSAVFSHWLILMGLAKWSILGGNVLQAPSPVLTTTAEPEELVANGSHPVAIVSKGVTSSRDDSPVEHSEVDPQANATSRHAGSAGVSIPLQGVWRTVSHKLGDKPEKVHDDARLV
ncbi:MAG: hypothetical protein N2C14_33475, partial [Planctomycetales bacterium]